MTKYQVMWTSGDRIECERMSVKAGSAEQAKAKALKKLKRELLPRHFADVKISHVGFA
jgi:hypothetical protein